MHGTSVSSTQFQGQMYLNLETYRKSGQAIVTPVWFAVDQQDSGLLYVRTYAKMGKVKRLRNNHKVRAVPCDRTGATVLYPNIASLRGAAGSLQKPVSWQQMQQIAYADRFAAKNESNS